MSVNINPNIATEGLVMSLDAANPRSYPGGGSRSEERRVGKEC